MRISDWSSDVCSSDLIFRTIDDVSAQDGRMTLSIEAIGDNTTERTTLVALEKVEGAMLDVNLSERQAPVYRVVGISLVDRSEEHTSELQSLMRISYAVFCLQQHNLTTDLQ